MSALALEHGSVHTLIVRSEDLGETRVLGAQYDAVEHVWLIPGSAADEIARSWAGLHDWTGEEARTAWYDEAGECWIFASKPEGDSDIVIQSWHASDKMWPLGDMPFSNLSTTVENPIHLRAENAVRRYEAAEVGNDQEEMLEILEVLREAVKAGVLK